MNKKHLISFFASLLTIVALFLGWKLLGRFAVEAIYNDYIPIPLFEGKAHLSIDHYHAHVDSVVMRVVNILLWLSAGAVILYAYIGVVIKVSRGGFSKKEERLEKSYAVIFSIAGVVLSLLCIPSIFNRFFAMVPLYSSEVKYMILFSLGLFLLAICLLAFRKKVKKHAFIGYVAVVLFLVVEFSYRSVVVQFFPGERARLGELGSRTYEDRMAYMGHPFIQFTGRPRVSLVGNEQLGNLSPYNNFGCVGDDFVYEKKDKTIRIAALGGSTTAAGYPAPLEEYLNINKGNNDYTFEVLNFGRGSWNSMHSVVNFIINVIDFSPDYVIFHHAINDQVARDPEDRSFRGDYSHVMKPFEMPSMPDRYIRRVSIIYRYLAHQLNPKPLWYSLDYAINIPRKNYANLDFSNLDELKPYRRNIETIMQVSKARKIKVILTTQPHNIDPDLRETGVTHMRQCNELMRKIVKESECGVLFVDLDDMITGKFNDSFREKDLVHMNAQGVQREAESIAKVILLDVEKALNPR